MRRPNRLAVPILFLACALARTAAAGEMHVAVLPFTNASKDAELESLGKGLQSMVTTDLANVVDVILPERLPNGDDAART